MLSVDKSTEEFEQELLFTQDPLTTDAKRIQNIVETKYSPEQDCHRMQLVKSKSTRKPTHAAQET
jgi:hypothetical protein